tara:strand:+ start:660 stop:848 length:189 start_codon:yes stop_codon:yes gene_type:complete
MKYDIKDLNYIAMISALVVALICLQIKYQNDSHSRIVECFADVVVETEYCESFFKKHNERNG